MAPDRGTPEDAEVDPEVLIHSLSQQAHAPRTAYERFMVQAVDRSRGEARLTLTLVAPKDDHKKPFGRGRRSHRAGSQDGSDCGGDGNGSADGNDSGDEAHLLHLEGDWVYTEVETGDFVHVIGSFDPETQTCVVDNDRNLLIVSPDLLISGTVIADSFKCVRRAVVGEVFPGPSAGNAPALYGQMIHELFQVGRARVGGGW